MEEKKKVWIRGRKGWGSEIKGILTGLGAKAAGIICEDGDCIYFINHNNEIDCVPGFSTELGQIIMDNYKEIKLPGQEWKDGDILVRADRIGIEFVVFKRLCDDDDYFFYHYPLFKGDGGGPLPVANYRKALNEEVLMFKELLASNGKEWDEEMKRVVKKVFKPLRGETYYYIHSSGAVCSEHWRAEPFQLDTRRFGNCFKTREKAVSAARKIRALLLDADDEDRAK